MSEQSKIIAAIHELVMEILKTGTASVEQGDQIDALEAKLAQQKCFVGIDNPAFANQGEEIANHFFNDKMQVGVDSMCEKSIDPEEFFEYVAYYYDDEHEDEKKIGMFTPSYIQEVKKTFLAKCS